MVGDSLVYTGDNFLGGSICGSITYTSTQPNDMCENHKISNIAEGILDDETKMLIETGFLSPDLNLTDKAKQALFEILFTQHMDKLVELAEEELEEEEDE